jgi:ADP-ribose pyrophosphatase YjhB (NUDIX family)
VLPKGHIERGESARVAALRELKEETGVVGRVVGELGAVGFKLPRERVRSQFYLAIPLRQGRALEDRERAWMPYTRALAATPFPNQRRMIARARTLFLRWDGPSRRPL